ncbi:MAG: RagB/SusD family nutrient uptake outer membrane protein [Chitinophagaceae bacterium]|nr:RagB/SusD family nutrient uptake outer membrane protein [Chitinophagaceae bacterium]
MHHIDYRRQVILPCFFLLVIFHFACKKIVNVKPPVQTITSGQVFADSTQSAGAINGIYTRLAKGSLSFGLGFGNSFTTILAGYSADELVPTFAGDFGDLFYRNLLIADNSTSPLWTEAYPIIYQTNACIEGLEQSTTISSTARDLMIGESKFLRAFCYFYIVNFFGEIPLITSTAWQQTQKTPKSSINDIYKQIEKDLLEASTKLRSDYSISSNERIRANQAAANALLARLYLYTNKWEEASNTSSLLINNNVLFSLNQDLNQVFSVNNSEAILQWNKNPTIDPYNVLTEGIFFLPYPDASSPPFNQVSDQLLNSFEADDLRKVSWIKTDTFYNFPYTYPFKYKVGFGDRQLGAPVTEQYVVLRLAEQYLIRAEALAHLNQLSEAVNDLNIIRNRAGLPSLPDNLDQAAVLQAVEDERRHELFLEWGHRWFDLKRTGRVDAVMSVVTPLKNGGKPWSSHQQYYPIPLDELSRNPFLSPTPGY